MKSFKENIIFEKNYDDIIAYLKSMNHFFGEEFGTFSKLSTVYFLLTT